MQVDVELTAEELEVFQGVFNFAEQNVYWEELKPTRIPDAYNTLWEKLEAAGLLPKQEPRL